MKWEACGVFLAAAFPNGSETVQAFPLSIARFVYSLGLASINRFAANVLFHTASPFCAQMVS